MMNYSQIHDECHAAGMTAGIKCRPIPMMVGEAKSIFSNEIDYTKQTYLLDEGACGFAWVTIYPGNSKLANAYKKLGLARPAYGGGVQHWITEFGQSAARKEAYARAYAAKLRELTGEERIYMGSRLD
jgi:hypothetical protein